jgi:hypothetical protein
MRSIAGPAGEPTQDSKRKNAAKRLTQRRLDLVLWLGFCSGLCPSLHLRSYLCLL